MSELSLVARDAAAGWSDVPLRAGSPPAPLRWTVVESGDAARLLIDQLVDRHDLPELASGSWWSAFRDGFHGRDAGVELRLLERAGQLLAAFPVRTCGRLVRGRFGLDNEHVPAWHAAVDPEALAADPTLAAALLDGLTEGVDYLELRRLPLEGALARGLKAAAAARGWPVAEWENPVGEVGLPLAGTWPELEQRLSKNLRRDARLLARLPGQLAFEAVTGGPQLEAELDACFELEARGWKGQLGTPVLADAEAHVFYRRLAERASRRGRFTLYLLKLDGRLIAFEYTLRGGGRIECLKIGYDETLSRFSPGTGLRMLILRRAIERGEAREYRLGRDSEWKRRWTTDLTRIGTLRLYAGHRRGQLAYYGGPALRELVKRLPGVQPLVAGLRTGLESIRDRVRLRAPGRQWRR